VLSTTILEASFDDHDWFIMFSDVLFSKLLVVHDVVRPS